MSVIISQEQVDDNERPIVIWFDNYQVYQTKTALHIDQKLFRISKMTAVAAMITDYDLYTDNDEIALL